MIMSFWLGTTLNDFLFKGFNITTLPGFLGVCASTAALAFLLVLITYNKEQFKNKEIHVSQTRHRTLRESETQPSIQIWSSQKYHGICTIFTLCQTTLGYFLMLIVMTYNAYLLMAVVVGSSLAYFSLNQHFIFHQFASIPHSKPNSNLQSNVEERGSLMSNQEETTPSVTTADVHE